MSEKWKIFLKISEEYKLFYVGAFIAIIMASICHFINPLIIKFAIDNLIAGKALEQNGFSVFLFRLLENRELAVNLMFIGFFLITITILQGLFQYLKGKWSATASEGIARNIRERVYEHIQNLPFSEHINAETGDWIQRCTSDVETVRRFFSVQLIEVGRALLMLVLVLPMMIKLSPELTIYSMLAVPVIFFFAIIFFVKVKKAFLQSDEAEGRLSTVLQENLSGVRVVRAFARENFEINKFDKCNKDYRDKTYKVIKLLAYYWSISDLICFIQIAAVIVAGTVLAVNGQITVGTIVVFISYETAILFPIRQMGRILTDTGKASIAWGRIYEILKINPEYNQEADLEPIIKGSISFESVSMSYNNHTKAIEDINFNIKPGQTIAFMGHSGSGKTTIIRTLLRFYEYSGSIKIDNIELKDINKKWIRRNVGSVLQEPFLYSKTLFENIRISNSNAGIPQVEDSASIAGIHNVINTFERKYHTLVGEKGVNLSGGQKQRVAIARAMIRSCPILVFDDSLSAVDTETERLILSQLKEKSKNSTVIIISHRLTTVMHADIINVMSKGKIAQSGNHSQLVQEKGIYQRLWNLQNEIEHDFQVEINKNNKKKKVS